MGPEAQGGPEGGGARVEAVLNVGGPEGRGGGTGGLSGGLGSGLSGGMAEGDGPWSPPAGKMNCFRWFLQRMICNDPIFDVGTAAAGNRCG